MRNYSGPRVRFPCPTTIHMKDTLNPCFLDIAENLLTGTYNKATTNLAFHSNETSKDKLSII